MVWLNLNGMLEHYPINQKVIDSIPGQGAYKRQLVDVSLSYLSLSASFPQNQ